MSEPTASGRGVDQERVGAGGRCGDESKGKSGGSEGPVKLTGVEVNGEGCDRAARMPGRSPGAGPLPVKERVAASAREGSRETLAGAVIAERADGPSM